MKLKKAEIKLVSEAAILFACTVVSHTLLLNHRFILMRRLKFLSTHTAIFKKSNFKIL